MTNKEWLATLPDEVLTYLILDGLPKYSRTNISSYHCINEWLSKEHTSEDIVEKYYILGADLGSDYE